MSDYTNKAQQRLVRGILALFSGDVITGMSNAQLAREVGCSTSVMLRDLHNLRTAGVAEQDETTGLWRLTPRLPQQALRALASIEAAERRVSEARQRFTTRPV